MVLVEFDIHQPFNLKDLENISLLYDNDIAMDFNTFINYMNNEVFYSYIKNSKNYLIKNNLPLLSKREEDMIQQELDIKNILLSFDNNLKELDNFRKELYKFNGNIRELVEFPVFISEKEEDKDDIPFDKDDTAQKIAFLKEKMKNFIGYEDVFLKKAEIFDDIVCLSVEVML